MKRQKPQIAMNLNNTESILDVLIKADIEECDVNGFHFFDETVEGLNISDMDISCCVFINCKFRNCIFEGVSFTNCLFKNCDLSFLNLTQGSLVRTEIVESRLSGINLTYGIISNVLLKSTPCRFTNFSEARLSCVEFIGCDMTSCSMDKCRVKQTEFTQCDLTGTDFTRTSLSGVDLRGNRITGIIFLGGELDGAIVDTAQAIGLVRLMGIKVEDH
jgi:uncharacterized protein YjbI with pentapeptide repeats